MAGVSDQRIRPAEHRDLPDILRLVHALAEYEREPDAVDADEGDFAAALFPFHGHPSTFCLVAEADGTVCGIAVWFLSFSTWTGRNGIWLEDLFVDPDRRGSGLGKALIAALAQICVEREYTRLEWTVLDWNSPSIDFYRSLGAVPMDEWTTQRLTGQALRALGASA